MSDLNLETLDEDGALRDGLDGVGIDTRAQFLRTTALGGGALLAALVAPGAAEAQRRSRSRDKRIINFALTLELLQDSFYSEVERLGALRGDLATQAKVVGAHERAHVRAFRDVLGQDAVKRPRFNFRGATEDSERFQRTAVAFEDLAVAAYKGQAPNIRSAEYLVPALAIHTVEARHAAWIRRLAGVSPAENAFDEPLSRRRVERVVRATNFTVRTRSRRRPRFTG